MTRDTLLELYENHQGKVSDKWQLYLVEYERLLASFRDETVRLLEIGIQNGGSLEIWAKYFSRAEIVLGCDVDHQCADLEFEDSRISVVVGDINNSETLTEILATSTEFDIVIDDGSHLSGDIIRTFGSLFPSLAVGGCYIIEDLHCSYWKEFEGGLFDPTSSIAFLKSLADIVNQEHWGLEKAGTELLEHFKSVHGIHIDNEALRLIHSVEFTDSMCTIWKAEKTRNLLGTRIVTGCDATVSDEPLGIAENKTLNVPGQSENPWSEPPVQPCKKPLELPPVAEHQNQSIEKMRQLIHRRDVQVQELSAEVQKRDIELYRLRQTLSWKLTAPLRKIWKMKYFDEKYYLDQNPDVALAGIDPFEHYENRGRMEGRLPRAPGTTSDLDLSSQIPRSDLGRNDYSEWVKRYDTLTEKDFAYIKNAVSKLEYKPLLSIVMPTYNTKLDWLQQAVDSVKAQVYENWELCIADDASTCEELKEYLATLPETDSRIKVVFREVNGHISEASNSGLEVATGEWVALMDHDDQLREHALYNVAAAINHHPDAQLIYSDEDKIDETGTRSQPYFKCDWNPDLFISHNMISHLGVYRRSLLLDIGGFRKGFEGSQDHDLALRCIEKIDQQHIIHIPEVLYHWRMHSESTASNIVAKPYAVRAGEKAIQEHFDRRGIAAKVGSDPFGYRVFYRLPDPEPLVTLVIPTRNGRNLLQKCIESIAETTLYGNYEIQIVDNGSDDTETLAYLKEIQGQPGIFIRRDPRPFNYAAINNSAVEHSNGEFIALVNNDVEVISPEWLGEMVSIACQPGVGAVGAKLLYPDGNIQHAGVVLGIGGVGNHAFKGQPGDSLGYVHRAKIVSTYSALTAACLVVRKSIYLEVGGLDSDNLAIAFNDVDFCLRVREAGYRNVWTPHAILFHHESASRGLEDTNEKMARFIKEINFMQSRWGPLLEKDPAYSPNLTLDRTDFSFAWPPRKPSFTKN